MKLAFTAFSVAIEATDLHTNKRVWVNINGSPSGGFTLSTEVIEDEVTAAAACKNDYVDLTTDHEEEKHRKNKASCGANPKRSDLFRKVEEKKNAAREFQDDLSLESELTQTEEVQFVGTGNKMQNVSIVNESDSSFEYETAVGLSQDPFGFPVSKKSAFPPRSNRKTKSEKF